VERLLKRDRTIVALSLAVLWALAWLYLATGAGLGMTTGQLVKASLLPPETAPAAGAMAGMDMGGMDMAGMAMPMPGMDMGAMPMAPEAWSLELWALTIAMWWVMMLAMMTPSAAPAILLYGRVEAHARTNSNAARVGSVGAFAAGYFLIWLGFSGVAAAVQWALAQNSLIAGATMASGSKWVSASVLAAAGVYQLSPLKNVCLTHCRSPASFLSRHWRPGLAGAVRLGVIHGAYCVGCCWLLMALLFFGGVMNLIWIAALSALVLAEKLLPGGQWVSRGSGVVLLTWAAVVAAG
jgi:predicted metal-binding membrane protein